MTRLMKLKQPGIVLITLLGLTLVGCTKTTGIKSIELKLTDAQVEEIARLACEEGAWEGIGWRETYPIEAIQSIKSNNAAREAWCSK